MGDISTPFIEASTYGCLYLAAVFLWVPKIDRVSLWAVALGFSLLFGLMGPTLNLVTISVIGTLALVLYCLQNERLPFFIRLLSALALCSLSLGLLVHQSFGFDHFLVLDKVQINYGEGVLGVLILGFLHERISTKKEWIRMLKGMSWRAVLLIIVLIAFTYTLKYATYHPRLPQGLWLFAVSNLFFICLTEEAFFRGFLQKYLCAVFGRLPLGAAFSIVLAAVLFAAAHFSSGRPYMLFSGLAGLGYGWIYFRTQRIEASILTHFAVNMVFFVLFSSLPILGKPH